MSENKKEDPELIAFRPDDDFAVVFMKKVKDLDVSVSELARRATKFGLDKAYEEIRMEKIAELRAALNRLESN